MDLSILKDLAELARNGYKPSDVKELLNTMKEDSDKKEEPKKEEPKKEEPKKDDKKELLDAFAKLVEDNK